MKYIPFSLMLLIICSQTSAGDCLLTKEYADARKDAYKKSKEVHSSYNECRDSIQTAYYWIAIAACTKEGLGRDIGGGCGHLISYGSYPMETPDKSHCEIFKVPIEIEVQYRKDLMSKINVKKCKT